MKKFPILVLWLAALFIVSCDSEPFESGDIKPMKAKEMKGKLQNKVLISEAIYNVVKNSVEAEFYEEMVVRGREQPVNTYDLHWV